jgi:hypothetical protein
MSEIQPIIPTADGRPPSWSPGRRSSPTCSPAQEQIIVKAMPVRAGGGRGRLPGPYSERWRRTAATWATRPARGSTRRCRPRLSTTTVELLREHDEVPMLIEQVRLATLALTQAAAATGEDRMHIPDLLAKSLTQLVVV